MSGHVRPSNDFIQFPREALERSIPDCFEEIVRRYPDRLAVKAGSHALTYDALNRAANRVARAILAHGGREEEPIAILLEKGALRIDAILGVLKAGRIYVPLDPAFPPERLRSMLGDSQAGLIVTHHTNLSLGSALARNAIPLLDTDGLDAGLSAENLGGSIHPDTIAYIMYTSGSTGRPKGVVQTHRTVLHAIMTHTDSLRICVDDRLSHVYSYSFSAATKSVFGALLNGAAVFPFDFQQEGLTGLAAWLTREEITIFHSVTSLFRHFAGSLTGEERFPRLRMIYIGGEAVTRRDVDLYKAHFSPECTFLVRLAITAAGAVRHYPIDRTTSVIEDVVPVGYAVPDKEVLLLDEAGNAVGVNGIGEIAVRSLFLAPGYWGQPDLTRGAFLPDPAGGNARIYRTGDLGRLLPDGCLEHLGRKDLQVKIRGLRADVAAIEAALLDGASLKEAVVLPREDASGDTRLIAYVVPAPGHAPTGSDLRTALRGKLPDHMIPSAFVVMDALPLLPSGKADRRALPEPEPTRGETGAAPVAPRDPLELQLTQLWEKVLGVRPVGVRDDFFELGGDSLLAARLLADVAKLSGRQLPLGILFRAPTVEQLAGLLRQKDRWSPGPP